MESYDLSDVFAMSETLETVLKRSIRDQTVATDFINAVVAQPAHFQRIASAEVYQGEDAAVKYLQFCIQCCGTQESETCLALLFGSANQKFWPTDTSTLELVDIQRAFQTVDALFPYSKMVFDHHPLVVMLHDGQVEDCNAESTAVFDEDGMRGVIQIYRMRENQGNVTAMHVFLHELGHLLHMRETKTVQDVPKSFLQFLRAIGADVARLSDRQLLELFADTFLIAVTFQAKELGDPFPEIEDNVKQMCFTYMKRFVRELA